MKAYYLFFLILILISSCVMAYSLNLREDEVKLTGTVSVTERTERTDGQVVHFWIAGESAEVIYYEMKPAPVYDECLGGYYKAEGDFFCFILDESEYGCSFGIHLSKQTLRETVVCD